MSCVCEMGLLIYYSMYGTLTVNKSLLYFFILLIQYTYEEVKNYSQGLSGS